MRKTIDFLRRSAEELRNLAESAPDISDHLRRLADELDATASDLEQRGNAPRGKLAQAGRIPLRNWACGGPRRAADAPSSTARPLRLCRGPRARSSAPLDRATRGRGPRGSARSAHPAGRA